MAKLTKKAKALATAFDREKLYGVDEAIAALKDASSKKFAETIEIAMNLGVDPRHADQMVRGVVTLPAGTGKDVKVAVFARGDKAEAALAAGADKVGAEDLLEDMQPHLHRQPWLRSFGLLPRLDAHQHKHHPFQLGPEQVVKPVAPLTQRPDPHRLVV